MSPEQSIQELFDFAQRRSQQAAQCEQYSSIVNRPMLELRDAGIFDSVAQAYNTYNETVELVKQKSKEAFENLPASLKFALRDLNKPLFIGSVRLYTGTMNYYLVAKQLINDEGKPVKGEFDYDVETA